VLPILPGFCASLCKFFNIFLLHRVTQRIHREPQRRKLNFHGNAFS
jgi:hypothetical protein